jgi:hypothetical protein
MMSNTHRCAFEPCPILAPAGGFCSKHAALKLLSAPSSPSNKKQQQQKLNSEEPPSLSRAHYEAVLREVDEALQFNSAPKSLQIFPSAAAREQNTSPLTRSAAAR